MVVPTKIEIEESSAWLVKSVKSCSKTLRFVEVHADPDFPSLEFAEERSFTEPAGGGTEVFEVVG